VTQESFYRKKGKKKRFSPESVAQESFYIEGTVRKNYREKYGEKYRDTIETR
jgi:hypothetical protein